MTKKTMILITKLTNHLCFHQKNFLFPRIHVLISLVFFTHTFSIYGLRYLSSRERKSEDVQPLRTSSDL
ncbi:hypothetical protein C2G38_2128235 [Gigaspora rosea]|uniref:Uncharacterized protein n=1 Tax=Gigaspora rosea TaxID=44941 RepID=A0A397U262_9GLOM|nr:hypothetical protein C2G38_2128235 [Gigaspora rosea]